MEYPHAGPLMFHQRCSTVEEIHVDSWDFSYEQISKGAFSADVTGLPVGGSSFLVLEVGSQSVYTSGTLSDNKFGLTAFLDSNGGGVVCGKSLEADGVALIRGGSSYEIYTNGPLNMFTVTFDLNDSRFDFLSDLMFDCRRGSEGTKALCSASGLYSKLFHFSGMYCRALDAVEKSGARSSLWMADLNDFLIFELLAELELALGASLKDGRVRSTAWMLKDVRELLLSSEYEDLSLVDICDKLRISPRTLRKNVFQNLGMGPLLFSRYVRLNAVRCDFVQYCKRGLDFRISDIAEKRGFWHLARFSGYYKNLFGELPSDTVKVLRSGRVTEGG